MSIAYILLACLNNPGEFVSIPT